MSVSGSQDSLLFTVDTGTHSATINELVTAYDGDLVITAGMDKRVRLWAIDDSTPEGLPILGRIGPGRDGRIEAVAAHPDELLVAIAVHSAPVGGSVLRLVDPQAEDVILAYDWPKPIADLGFTSDGSWCVVATKEHEGPTADAATLDIYACKHLLEPKPGPELRNPPPPVFSTELVIDPARLAIFPSDDGGSTSVVVTPTMLDRPQMFDLSSEELRFNPTFTDLRIEVGRSATVATSEESIAFAGRDSGLIVVDRGGTLLHEDDYSGVDGCPAGVAFSPDGSRLVVGSRAGAESTVTVYDVNGDFRVAGQRRYDDDAMAVGFVDDFTVVSAGGSRFTVHYWPAETTANGSNDYLRDGVGQVVDAVGLNVNQIGFGNPDPVSPDGAGVTGLAPTSQSPPSLSRRFDLSRLALIPSSQELTEPVGLDAFRRATWTGPSGEPRLDAEDEHVYWEPGSVALTGHGQFPSNPATAYSLVDDARAVIAERNGVVRVLEPRRPSDRSKGRYAGGLNGRTLVGHLSAVLDIAVGERWLVSGGRDQIMRLWFRPDATATGEDPDSVEEALEPALNLFVTATDEWVIWSRSGYYASSQEGDRHIAFHHNRGDARIARSYTGDRFVKHLYRPDIIQQILEVGSEAAALEALHVEPFDIEAALPPHVRMISTVEWQDNLEYDLEFEVFEAANKTTKVLILQNGVPAVEIEVDHEGVEPGSFRRFNELIFLEPGVNLLSITAENEVARAVPAEIEVTTGTLMSEVIALPPPPSAGVVEGIEFPPDEDSAFEDEVDNVAIGGDVDDYPGPDGGGKGAHFHLGGEADEDDLDAATDDSAVVAASKDGAVDDHPPPAGVRVDGAELRVTIEVGDDHEPVILSAWRNSAEVWWSHLSPGTGLDSELTIPLEEGHNVIEVLAEANGRSTVLLTSELELPIEWDPADERPMDEPPPDDPELVPLDPLTSPKDNDPDDSLIYVVKKGETLRDVAEIHYKDRALYRLIFEANEHLKDPDRVATGTKLVIPSLAPVVDEPKGGELDLGSEVEFEEEISSDDPPDLITPPGPAVGEKGGIFSSEPMRLPESGNEFDASELGGGVHSKGTPDPRPLPAPSDSGTPNLYLLSVGVTDLLNQSADLRPLKWSGDDAAEIATRFKRCEGPGFGKVHQIGIGDRGAITGTDATKANIDAAVDDLAKAVKARANEKRQDRVGTTDVTILFFSGHGMSRAAAEGEPEGLYLIPYDYDENRWQETAVSLLDIADKLCKLPKTELIIMIDACRSGVAGTDVARRVESEQLGKRLEALSPRTIYVLSSTARDLDSWELKFKYPYDRTKPNRVLKGHGLFTHAIIKRFDEADDRGEALSILGLAATVQDQIVKWRRWKPLADRGIRQDPWYRFHESFGYVQLYKTDPK